MPQHAAGRDGDSVQRGGRGAPQDVAQSDRGQPQPAVVNGRERSADAVPERKNGKGKGNKKGQEADSEDERDDGGPKRKRRDE
jgi:hypothetical protein